jgi:hypothetical protein
MSPEQAASTAALARLRGEIGEDRAAEGKRLRAVAPSITQALDAFDSFLTRAMEATTTG